jgi:cell division protein FtsW
MGSTMVKKGQAKALAERGAEELKNVLGTVFRGQSAEFKALWAIIVFLALFGALMVYSSSYVDSVKNTSGPFSELRSEAFGMFFGTIALVWCAYIRPQTAQKLGPLLAAGFVVLQLLVLTTPLGVAVNGNRNWLNLGIATVQPSEFLKIAMIMMVSQFIVGNKNLDKEDRQFWVAPISVFAVLFVLVGLLSKDMGTVIVMAIILVGMFFLGGLPDKFLKYVLAAGVGGILLLFSLGGTRRGRILAWLFPNNPDPNQYNWQAEHGKWAFASGGLFGVGPGNSKMKWSWIPEAQNDFIFAIIGEEYGLIGAITVIGLFIFLGITLFKIAKKTPDLYQRLFIYGVTFWIIGQGFINISVVLTMLPVLGVNLPLISAGGTSMVATLMALGMVMGIERNNHQAPRLRVVRGSR